MFAFISSENRILLLVICSAWNLNRFMKGKQYELPKVTPSFAFRILTELMDFDILKEKK